MYNYIMLLMTAIDQEREEKENKKQGTKSPQQLAKEKSESLRALLYGTDPKSKASLQNEGMITIEVSPEDMKRARKEKAAREEEIKKKRFGTTSTTTNTATSKLPSGTKRVTGK